MSEKYFSPKLMKKLSQISNCAFTLVEAPAGYGKTTAIRYGLDMDRSANTQWYTSVESAQDGSLYWFISQIEKLDASTGAALRELGFLNRSNAPIAARLIQELNVEENCYLILDNFHLAISSWQAPILQALAQRKKDGLHVILISQNFGRTYSSLKNTSPICYINYRDLSLDSYDIKSFGQTLDLTLSDSQAEYIFGRTEGWAAAVYLYLQQIKENQGKLAEFKSIDALLLEIFYRSLKPFEKEIILRSSVFDFLSQEQIYYLLPGYVDQLTYIFSRVPLLRYDENTYNYYPHEILRNFLLKQLFLKDEEFRFSVFHDAGQWYKRIGENKNAVACFFKVEDYDGLLSCELTGLLSEDFNGASYTALAKKVLNSCPEDILAKYPVSMLRLCMALYAGAEFDEFAKAIERSCGIIEKSGDTHMLGEWFLVSAFSEFPNTVEMKNRYLQAEALMQGESLVIDKRDPFMFGTTSMWYLFYSTPGQMMEEAENLREMLLVYNRLTNDHGAGAYELYMGEALSVQGDFDQADIFAHKAALISEKSQNASVTYGAALLRGINAIYQSDMLSLQRAIEYLETKALSYTFLQGTAINRLMTETVRGYLLGLMMEPSQSADWTRGEADAVDDLTFTSFMIKTNRVTDLILKKQYKKAIASVEISLTLDSRLISLSTRNFMYVGLSLCYLAIAHPIKAAEWLDKSLDIAEKDRNFTFLACFRSYLSVLFLFPSIRNKHEKAISQIKAMNIRYTKADESRIFAMINTLPDQAEELSEREREVAELVAQGFHNKEIAKKLFISEETVKSHIRSIFKKTNIDRRSRIVELLK